MSDLMEGVKNLREITGAGFLDCKKALEECSHDIDLSIDFLRKKGLAKANKKSSREAKEGAIGVYSNDKISTIIQINTETDFAAKNEVFLNFMDQIGKFVLEVDDIDISLENFVKLSFQNKIKSNTPSEASISVIALVNASAVFCGSQTGSSSGKRIKLLTPTLAAYLSCSSAASGPKVIAVTSPPWFSTS